MGEPFEHSFPLEPYESVQGFTDPPFPRTIVYDHINSSESANARQNFGVGSGSDHDPCHYPGCNATFTGRWARSHFRRHVRMKHKDGGRQYSCEVTGCESVFERQDARLKHYRKHHPDLAATPIVLGPRYVNFDSLSGTRVQSDQVTVISNRSASRDDFYVIDSDSVEATPQFHISTPEQMRSGKDRDVQSVHSNN
jgi:hypothetical protein